MILRLLPEKINKIPRILHDFCTKNARLDNKTTRSRPGRGQNLEAEAEAKASRRRPKLRKIVKTKKDQNTTERSQSIIYILV